ncbi:hypothetical protein [Micromonospora avicenniae]|uniref:DoxX protein n=1 Tax=Micromonospora avicenniae TaxID=1198245 RepID=A0A1N7BT83_9ACTN|nr:hypothetical protein [Micromonospora avicenniae]SIR54545.1 hypothetical protein SAMN05444858_111189 [Micromonospora avicenniae]
MRIAHVPLRASIGAYMLNSGLTKRNLEGEAAQATHSMAVGAIPQLRQVPPDRFAKVLSYSELALGAALLVPLVPSALVGLGLTAFGAGLVQLYLKTPGLRQPGSVRPTEAGSGLAKDVWLVGAGLTLVLDGLIPRRLRR